MHNVVSVFMEDSKMLEEMTGFLPIPVRCLAQNRCSLNMCWISKWIHGRSKESIVCPWQAENSHKKTRLWWGNKGQTEGILGTGLSWRWRPWDWPANKARAWGGESSRWGELDDQRWRVEVNRVWVRSSQSLKQPCLTLSNTPDVQSTVLGLWGRQSWTRLHTTFKKLNSSRATKIFTQITTEWDQIPGFQEPREWRGGKLACRSRIVLGKCHHLHQVLWSAGVHYLQEP